MATSTNIFLISMWQQSIMHDSPFLDFKTLIFHFSRSLSLSLRSLRMKRKANNDEVERWAKFFYCWFFKICIFLWRSKLKKYIWERTKTTMSVTKTTTTNNDRRGRAGREMKNKKKFYFSVISWNQRCSVQNVIEYILFS